MWDVIKAVMCFFRTIIEEENGVGSASRLIGIGVASCCMVALLQAVHYAHSLPSHDQLIGLAEILGVGIGAYGFNQIKAAVMNAGSTKPDNPDQPKE